MAVRPARSLQPHLSPASARRARNRFQQGGVGSNVDIRGSPCGRRVGPSLPAAVDFVDWEMSTIDSPVGFLRLSFERDDDGTAELIAHVNAGGFAGASSAWFNIDEISKFARQLGQYPIDFNSPLQLAGGSWAKDQRGVLDEIHLSLRVYSVSNRGQVGMHVLLATRSWHDMRPESRCSVETELLTSYQALVSFSNELLALTESARSEAILFEDLLA